MRSLLIRLLIPACFFSVPVYSCLVGQEQTTATLASDEEQLNIHRKNAVEAWKQIDSYVKSFNVTATFSQEAIADADDIKSLMRLKALLIEERTIAFARPNLLYQSLDVAESGFVPIESMAPLQFGESESEASLRKQVVGDSPSGYSPPIPLPQAIRSKTCFDGALLKRDIPGVQADQIPLKSVEQLSSWFKLDYLKAGGLLPDDINKSHAKYRVLDSLLNPESAFSFEALTDADDVCLCIQHKEGDVRLYLSTKDYNLLAIEEFEQNRIITRTTISSHYNQSPHAPLPMRLSIQHFFPAWSEKAGNVAFETNAEVSEIAINSVDLSVFKDLTFSQGTLVFDETIKETGSGGKPVAYWMPADPGRVNEAIDRALGKHNFQDNKSSFGSYLIIANIILFVALGAYLAKRKLAGR